MRYLFFLSILVCFACKGTGQQNNKTVASAINQVELKQEINKLEDILKSNSSGKVDLAQANELIEKSILYIETFPKDSLSPAYLFRTGEVCVGIKNYEKGLKLWEKLRTEYKTHEKAAAALFLQGFTAENQMQDIPIAKGYYNRFLEEYPNHTYADQVKMLLKNIDISPEELIKSFQKKTKGSE